MIDAINRYFETPEDKDPAFIRLTRNILLFALAATIFSIIAVSVEASESDFVTVAVLIAMGILEVTALIRVVRGHLTLARVIVPIALIIAITIIAFSAHSIHDISVVAYPLIIIVATLLQSKRATIVTLPLTIAAITLLGVLDMTGRSSTIIAQRTGIDDIAIGIILLVASSGILNLMVNRLNQALESSRANERAQIETNTELKELQVNLEQSIENRTAELEKANQQNEQRAKQFEAITLVSGTITLIRSLDELLPRITELISEQFGYYHVGIFLNDASNEYAVLSAANSSGGKRMLKRGHQLKIGEEGIVGYTANTGKPRIALDVGEDAVYFNNPDMPETRSEIALPLKVEDVTVGVLDVQSRKEAAFKEEDVRILSLLASQVSLAIENARLFDQARKSLAESEALYRQYIRQAWTKLPKEQNLAGYRYNARGSFPIEKKVSAKPRSAQDEVETEVRRPRVSVPIEIRGETIGTLSVQIPESNDINADQMDLVNAVAERVALSAENARLFEETNRRAERERLVSDITVKIRSTNDPDDMIQIALNELKNALGATKVELVPHTLKDVGRITKPISSTHTQVPQENKKKLGEEE